MRKRRKNGAGPVTVLSCDNLQHNGDTARKAFISFIEAQDSELARWVKKNVTFPNSMVDRITPAVTPDDVKRLNAQSGVEDAAPVYSEDFIQWVIEDDFIAGRPDWEAAGAEFTDDVSAYENMKLSLLNASHSLLSYPAFLAGYRRVDEAVRDEICPLSAPFHGPGRRPLCSGPGKYGFGAVQEDPAGALRQQGRQRPDQPPVL